LALCIVFLFSFSFQYVIHNVIPAHLNTRNNALFVGFGKRSKLTSFSSSDGIERNSLISTFSLLPRDHRTKFVITDAVSNTAMIITT